MGSSAALSVPLKQAVVEDYLDRPACPLMPDRGVTISGNHTGRVGMEGNQQISTRMALGEERAAGEIQAVLFKAVNITRA